MAWSGGFIFAIIFCRSALKSATSQQFISFDPKFTYAFWSAQPTSTPDCLSGTREFLDCLLVSSRSLGLSRLPYTFRLDRAGLSSKHENYAIKPLIDAKYLKNSPTLSAPDWLAFCPFHLLCISDRSGLFSPVGLGVEGALLLELRPLLTDLLVCSAAIANCLSRNVPCNKKRKLDEILKR